MFLHALRLALALVATTTVAAKAIAQSDDLVALNQQVIRLYNAGKYQEALPVARRAAS